MRSSTRTLMASLIAVLVGATSACGAPADASSLVARAPDGLRVAVATAGARNVRVLHVDGGSIVRLHEVFVPEGGAIAAIAWSADGRELLVTTRGPLYAVDTRTWRIAPDAGHARRAADDARRG
jgi:hypothetical protein